MYSCKGGVVMQTVSIIGTNRSFTVGNRVVVYKGHGAASEYTIVSVDENKGTFTYNISNETSPIKDTVKKINHTIEEADMSSASDYIKMYARDNAVSKVYPIQREFSFDFRCDCGEIKHIPITILKEVRQVRITGVRCNGCGVSRIFEAVFND